MHTTSVLFLASVAAEAERHMKILQAVDPGIRGDTARFTAVVRTQARAGRWSHDDIEHALATTITGFAKRGIIAARQLGCHGEIAELVTRLRSVHQDLPLLMA